MLPSMRQRVDVYQITEAGNPTIAPTRVAPGLRASIRPLTNSEALNSAALHEHRATHLLRVERNSAIVVDAAVKRPDRDYAYRVLSVRDSVTETAAGADYLLCELSIIDELQVASW